jgi:hypothetical protein
MNTCDYWLSCSHDGSCTAHAARRWRSDAVSESMVSCSETLPTRGVADESVYMCTSTGCDQQREVAVNGCSGKSPLTKQFAQGASSCGASGATAPAPAPVNLTSPPSKTNNRICTKPPTEIRTILLSSPNRAFCSQPRAHRRLLCRTSSPDHGIINLPNSQERRQGRLVRQAAPVRASHTAKDHRRAGRG